MKDLFKILLGFALVCFVSFVHADESNDFVTGVNYDSANKQRVVQAVVGVIDAGQQTLSSGSVISLGSKIPSGSIVTFGFIKAVTDITSADSNTVSIGCDTSSDLASAVALGGASSGDKLAVVADGTLANAVIVDQACTLQLTVGSGTSGITAGRANAVFFFFPTE